MLAVHGCDCSADVNGCKVAEAGEVQGFLQLLRIPDNTSCCSLDVRLYVLIPSVLRWPVHSMTSCSSTTDE